ncbi:hypothetical protein NET02_16155, partial [Thermomicrobiaceae bacterium CFH 74404]|nr:hypothetical protein [Thermalbibacter longus]
PLLAQGKPEVSGVTGMYDYEGELVGAAVGLDFPAPIRLKGAFPVVVIPEYQDVEAIEVIPQDIDESVSTIVVLVHFREERALGLSGWY